MKITLLFLTVFITSYLLHIDPAYAGDTLTWEECICEAKENHPDLISAAERVKQAKRDIEIDLSSILPQVNSSASGKRGRASTAKTRNTYTYGVTGEQLVFDGFKTSSEVSNSFKIMKAVEYTYAVTSSNIRLNLRSAFTELLKAQELITLTEDIVNRRKQNLELVRLRFNAGREHKGSLLTAEADLAQAEFEAAQAERNMSIVQRELTKELGRSVKKEIKAEGNFSLGVDYGAAADFERLADETPFLKELIARKEAARYNLLSKESDFFPQVYLNASAGKTSKSFLPKNEEWSLGWAVSFPLFEGGSRIAEVSKAKSQYNQAKVDERSGRDSVLVTLESAWKNLQDGTANVSVKNKFLEAAEERSKIASVQYEQGLISFDNWIIIENNLVDAKKEYLNAEADMLINEAYWIQAIGGTLDYDKH